jgi:cell wall-associated NlpC family hydrolase
VLATGGVVLSVPTAAQAASSIDFYSGQRIASAVSTVDHRLGPVVPRKKAPAWATHSELAVDKLSIQTGQSIVFIGRLTNGVTNKPVSNHALRLEQSAGGEWKTVGSALANADGSVTFTVKPAASASYRLSYAGVWTLAASVSPVQAVTVKAPPPPPPPRPVARASAPASSSAAPGIGSNQLGGSATAASIVAAAAAQAGKPYSWGAAGPNAFDCSGLTQYVFGQFGIGLPHNAHSQMGYGTPVSAANAAPGDLVFFLDGGYAYHVGIYAGGNQMWDAPNSGSTVGLHTIWTSNVVFRRIV